MARHPGRFLPTRAPKAVVVLALALALTTVAAACGTSGRSMEDPEPGATAPPRRSDVSSTVAGGNTLIPAGLFSLTSPAFAPNGAIPAEHTCDGAGISPPFTWGNVPEGTVELVLLVTDPDAGGVIHWMVTGIDPSTTELPSGTVPAAAVVLTSSDGQPAWLPICPPPGPAHTYEFTLYSLSSPSGLTPAADTRAASVQVATSATQTAVLTGTYARTTAN